MTTDENTNPFLQTSTNPFEDDVDDDIFLKTSPSCYKVAQHSMNPFIDEAAQVDDNSVERREEILQSRALASTERSLAVLMESELAGEGIAKELADQREQLENCHNKVHDINSNLRTSQKHLKRIKSVFGGFKDFLMGVRIKPVKKLSPADKCSDDSSGGRQAGVARKSRSKTVKQTASSHPGMMLRSSDGDNANSRNVQTTIDRNLDQMFNHVVNLKELATDLGDELDNHNELLDSLNEKTEEAQIMLEKQNKDIAKLLK